MDGNYQLTHIRVSLWWTDPGIMFKFDPVILNQRDRKHGLLAKDLPRKFDELSTGAPSSRSSASISSIPAHNSCRKGSIGGSGGTGTQMKVSNRKTSCSVGGSSVHCLCMKIVAKRMGQLSRMAQVKMLCSAHYAILRCVSSANCRNCDKCVDGFDNRCRGSTTVLAGKIMFLLYLLWRPVSFG